MKFVKELLVITLLFWPLGVLGAGISESTQMCLECHRMVTPGIVSNWESSIHAKVSPLEALKRTKLKQEISATSFPNSLKKNVVGCAECHTLNPNIHKDSFEHNGFKVHVIVTPKDCAVCHPKEFQQYTLNKMDWAYKNLMGNPVYFQLVKAIVGLPDNSKGIIAQKMPEPSVLEDSCLACHGTRVKVEGFKERDTDFGNMKFPILKGWPNQGVGRINPDGSRGCCTSCHTRHSFSIAMARKPYSCAQCHKGPDTPAYKVYSVSTHGAIFKSSGNKWDFKDTPWVLGKDFKAPTCATCHVSLLVDTDGNIIARRTHRFNDRLAERIFGIYAHLQPTSPDTSQIKNAQGLPLPTGLFGNPAKGYLIAPQQAQIRRQKMVAICLNCHSQNWVRGHFDRLQKIIIETNERTKVATQLLTQAWKAGINQGLPQGKPIFDETIEKMWAKQWLFYENSVRFSAAMAGHDYGTFAKGRFDSIENLIRMEDLLKSR